MLNNRYKNLLNQSALYGLSIFLMKGISLIMLPIYTSYLMPTEYGRLEVLVVFSNIVSIVLGFGLVEALYRFVGLADSIEKKQRHAAECLLVAAIIAIISYAIFHFYSKDLLPFLPGDITENELYLLGVALSVGGLINIPLAWLRITERAGLFFIISILKVVLQVSLTFYWLINGWGITSILASGAVSSVIVAIILCVIQLKEIQVRFSITDVISNIKKIIYYAGPIFIGGAATFTLSGMDRWLLAEHFGATQIAAYAIAIKFALVPTLLIQPFTLWWFPKRFSVLKEHDGKNINAHFAVLGAIISVLLCGGLGLIGPLLIQHLTPTAYHGAIAILPWLLLCTLFKMLADLLNLGCFVEKSTRLQMNINLASSGIGGLLLVVLVPLFMIEGALIALIAANVIRMGLFYYYSQQKIYLPYKFAYLYPAISAAVVATWFGQMS
ncbi:lipopolysaccharide biosynthesis protein [Colwellia psychrerythraea]|uniref:Polysaccharide biosynthesis protein n=1 Tax=Colwellia psychrerythraea TaxID=28229 RepID=A0A099KAB8_COLPS|nr:oligosaccharide flippase family protein [Colwellia psychrerythraea]KGJ86548.1 polysaccharide biosynthesis protein [Colwellia psychrerythraea]